MTARGITIVGASAGSGKTFRLTKEVTDAVSSIPPEALVAVTYTRKAHAELAARIRQKLMSAGAFEAAARISLAYVGTVHAVCLRLVQELAFDVGVSPQVDVLAGDEGAALRESLERSLSVDDCAELDRLAARMELLFQPQVERHDWLRPVTDIMELARSNRIAPDDLAAMAERSIGALLALFPPAEADGVALDTRLAGELARASAALEASVDATKTTRTARQIIDECLQRARDGELAWRHWEKLARIATAKASDALVAPLRAAAADYMRHPALREDIANLTRAVYAAARAGLDGYAAWKTERRVIDYVDMVATALDATFRPRVAEELAARLRFVVVDEFQDTSPIQLALFMRLHALAGRSVWVGDRKQCIFEYAGADPLLMDAVTAWVDVAGGDRDTLRENHRSRPELVDACSELFAAALARHGFAREEVVVSAARSAVVEASALAPFGVFALETGKKSQDAAAIAEGIARLLSSPSDTPVVDRVTGRARPLSPRDIAVLVATNAEAAELALALHARGLRATLARAGLLATPQGMLADAALRMLLDAHDALSSAIIDALTGYGGRSPEEWLATRIADLASGTAGVAGVSDVGPADASGWRAALAVVRAAVPVLSPREALEEALAALDAVRMCARWPDPSQRIANLDALRTTASKYEGRCAQRREAATVAGLLRHFDDLRTPRLRRDELVASDEQHVANDGDAITVCTYHKAKGLEWPVVVLASLDRTERRHAFEVSPESDHEGAGFDPVNPLTGRWIRWWPWPLGGLDKAPLAAAAEASPEGRRVAEREARERLRLLYVGFTRARDHLVFAVRVTAGNTRAPWLDKLVGSEGERLLTLPATTEDGACTEATIRVDDLHSRRVRTRVFRLGLGVVPDRGRARANDRAPVWFARSNRAGPVSRYRISPSRAAEDWPELTARRIGRVERLLVAHPFRLEAKDLRWDALGIAVHAFLASDVRGLVDGERRERAEALLAGAGLSEVIGTDSVLAVGSALTRWVDARWPAARWLREVPIEVAVPSVHGERRLSGVIDLLLETEGRVVIDHKTFPAAAESAWRARVKDYLPQMSAYAAALEAFGGVPVAGVWVHFALGGGVVEIVR